MSTDQLRTSAAERERAIDVLKAAYAEGRLDAAELTERTGQARQSRTYAELADLTADLPVGPLGTASPRPTATRLATRPAAGPPAAPAPWQNVSGSAAASLAAGVVTVLARNNVADVIAAIVAVTLGMAALIAISSSGRRGQAMAIAGIILGTAGALAGLAFPHL
jgi:hypothetical protein